MGYYLYTVRMWILFLCISMYVFMYIDTIPMTALSMVFSLSSGCQQGVCKQRWIRLYSSHTSVFMDIIGRDTGCLLWWQFNTDFERAQSLLYSTWTTVKMIKLMGIQQKRRMMIHRNCVVDQRREWQCQWQEMISEGELIYRAWNNNLKLVGHSLKTGAFL